MKKQSKTLVGDFETTVYKNQTYTEVWASAVVELFTEDVKIFRSIGDTFSYFQSLSSNLTVYYHNLKFDGQFWVDFLMKVLHFKLAFDPTTNTWIEDKNMPANSFKIMVSALGMWYSITIKSHGFIIQLRDSLKLLPFSVEELGKSFNTKHKKLNMEYKGFRYSGCPISQTEKEYIANDVFVVKEALETLYTQGHTRLTIGSCCLSEYKSLIGRYAYEMYFPDLSLVSIPEEYGSKTVDEYVRKSYHGGWCYLVPEKANRILFDGLTCDVNSLYPSMMSSESGNLYPTGRGTFFKGKVSESTLKDDHIYWFQRIKTRFKLRDGYLPCIQIKGSPLYRSTEWLTTSDVYDKKRNLLIQNKVELTLTMTDFKLISEHYILYDTEYLDGVYFWGEIGIFDEYIEKYKKIKLESKGAIRTLAKLFLNNLYGKMASSTVSDFKVPYIGKSEIISYEPHFANEKESGYIPCGSAITSYARNFTIRAAQANFHGPNQRGFVYSDTDSIHCDLEPDELINVPINERDFCHWKLESNWDFSLFVRQKTYIEHITKNDGEDVEPYYDVKCAGMPEKAKRMFIASVTGKYDENEYTDVQLSFVKERRKLTDFKSGLVIPEAKLLPKRIDGGIVLVDTTYEMRNFNIGR